MLLSAALEEVAGTGLGGYERFMTAVEHYRADLEQGLRARYPLDPVNGYGADGEAGRKVRAVPVSLDDLPVLATDRPPVAAIALPAVLLALLDLLLLLAAVLAANRCDVR